MAIVLPAFFRVWSRLGREAYDAEERIGHVSEQEVAVENDHWLRSTGVLRYPMATNVYGDGDAWDGATQYGGAIETGTSGLVVYKSRMGLADGRTRVDFRVHWGVAGASPGVAIGGASITLNVYDANTAVVLDTATFGALTVAGTYALNTHTTPVLASTDIRIEVVATITGGTVRLFSVLAVEDAMTLGEL